MSKLFELVVVFIGQFLLVFVPLTRYVFDLLVPHSIECHQLLLVRVHHLCCFSSVSGDHLVQTAIFEILFQLLDLHSAGLSTNVVAVLHVDRHLQ